MFESVVFALSLLVVFSVIALRSKSMADWPLLLGATGCLFGGVGLLIVVLSAFRTGSSSGSGVSVGTVVNVGHEGFWWNVPAVHVLHKGEMDAELFGIDEKLLPTALDYAGSGVRVRVHYTSSTVCGAWRTPSCDVIDSIEADPEEGAKQ